MRMAQAGFFPKVAKLREPPEFYSFNTPLISMRPSPKPSYGSASIFIGQLLSTERIPPIFVTKSNALNTTV